MGLKCPDTRWDPLGFCAFEEQQRHTAKDRLGGKTVRMTDEQVILKVRAGGV